MQQQTAAKSHPLMQSASIGSISAETLSSACETCTEQVQQQASVQDSLDGSSVGVYTTSTMRSRYRRRRQRVSLPPVQQRYGGDLVSSWHQGPFTLSDSKISWLARQHRPPRHKHRKSESSPDLASHYEQYSDPQARKLGMQNMLMLMGMTKEGVVAKVNRIQRSNMQSKPKRKRMLKQIGRSSSKDLRILQEEEERNRNLELYEAALALATVPARREVKSADFDAQDMLQCAQTEENMCHFQRGTMLPRVVQERCATPVGILLDAADPIPR